MTTKTFSVTVDYGTLAGVGTTEKIGKVTFTPRFASNSGWTTDGSRVVDAQPVTMEVTSAGGPQTFQLAHPEGWVVGFTWVVSVVIEGRTVLALPLRTPPPDTINALPSLLDIVPAVPGATVTMQTLVAPVTIPDGYVLTKDGATIVGLDPATLGGDGGAPAVHTHPISDVVSLQGVLDGKASASHAHAPTDITGTAVITSDPRLSDARTPTAHSHATTDITGFTTAVDARVQNIVGAAPAALDTLSELADALGDDANFAATVTTELAGKVSTTTVPSINAGPIANRPATPVAGSLYIEVILP